MNRSFSAKAVYLCQGVALALLLHSSAIAAPPAPTAPKTPKTSAAPQNTKATTAAKTTTAPAAKESDNAQKPAEKGTDAPQKDINPQQWILRLPSVAKDKTQWRKLIAALIDSQMDYGAVMAASRMLIFFEDIESKEFAFRTLIEQSDIAWPYSVRELFIPGDVNPNTADSFAHTYNLYKALLSEKDGMALWAKNYYSRIDKEKSPKYQFHLAIQKYSQGETEEAIKILREILAVEVDQPQPYFVAKVARTLARIYYEKERYRESLDIYESLLLKLNPKSPTDWLEAAWNLYRLNRHTRALGYLYNMESRESGALNNIERYVVRAAIYRDNCDTQRMAALSDTFAQDHAEVIDGIRSGIALDKYDVLHELNIPENVEYNSSFFKLKGLRKEQSRVNELPKAFQQLAQYLYRTEIAAHEVYLRLHMNEALLRSAARIFSVSEGLKFLSFDVAREKFNPNVVFESKKIEREIFSERSLLYPDRQIKWRQFDDFWRDERRSFLVGVKNRCAE